MLFEKKMLILTGEGKGVVLIEKNGLGVKFAVRTFDLKHTSGLKAGIVTPSQVFVRDLPPADGGAAVFYVDCKDISELHFAVFDDKLRLYGATCKRMWESNLMDLLIKKCSPSFPARAALSAPAAKATYGDDALASSDFYTPFDFSERMKTVDAFLDTPRILSGEPAPAQECASAEAASVANAPESGTEQESAAAPAEETTAVEEPATDAPELPRRMPWEYTSEWLSSRGKRELKTPEPEAVEPIKQKGEVKRLREASFREKNAADVQKLFSSSPRDDELNALFPELEWIRVAFEGKPLSVGRGDGLLCYAVPGAYENPSPLGDEAQWLPKLKNAPAGKGYWLLFQNTATGEIIRPIGG